MGIELYVGLAEDGEDGDNVEAPVGALGGEVDAHCVGGNELAPENDYIEARLPEL